MKKAIKTVKVDFERLPEGKECFVGIFDLIATAAGYDPSKVKKYDCTKIDISQDGQDVLSQSLF